MKSPREALQPEAVPPPPLSPRRRRASLVSILSGVLSFIVVAIVVAGIGWSFAVRRIGEPGPLVADKTVNIPKGDDVAETLEDQGVVENAQLMKVALLVEGKKSSVKAGEYLFKQNASLQDVIDTLVSGKQVLHGITIPEGLTSLQAVERLRDNDVLVGDIKNIPPEGSLMPDTYKFSRGTSRDQLIKTMQQESHRVIADVWSHRSGDSPIRSPSEMVTLASIVEKETGKADERPRVAGVFINRLAKNMPLQSDPTIVYGLVGGKGTLGRGILKSEVEQKTPYNTYAIVGLPPGPIANPGKAALEAVANPSKTRELYFVADGTGGHAFAETLDQHRINVLKWRQVEKDAKDRLDPDAEKLGPAAPASPTPGKPNQRGDAAGEDRTFALGPGDPPAQLAAAGAPSENPDGLRRTLSSDEPLPTPPPAKPPSPYSKEKFAEIELQLPEEAAAGGDETASEPVDAGSGSLATFPVAASRQAEWKARAAAYGLPTTGPDRSAPVQTAMDMTNAPLPNGRRRIFDASEGTSLDPLLDRTYDLNTAKSVPAIKALPPISAYLPQ